MRLLMIVHGRVERPRDAGVERPRDRRVERPRDRRVERPSETSARHSFALCVLLVIRCGYQYLFWLMSYLLIT